MKFDFEKAKADAALVARETKERAERLAFEVGQRGELAANRVKSAYGSAKEKEKERLEQLRLRAELARYKGEEVYGQGKEAYRSGAEAVGELKLERTLAEGSRKPLKRRVFVSRGKGTGLSKPRVPPLEGFGHKSKFSFKSRSSGLSFGSRSSGLKSFNFGSSKVKRVVRSSPRVDLRFGKSPIGESKFKL
jgi:hypothetical protein